MVFLEFVVVEGTVEIELALPAALVYSHSVDLALSELVAAAVEEVAIFAAAFEAASDFLAGLVAAFVAAVVVQQYSNG